jgi:ectoine hydroxylase-related dioxygenase (phytanoyl-CoA dioxygenase family)
VSSSAVGQNVAEIASDGWTIIPNAIEPALVDALRRDLDRLERELDIRPAGNSFEGAATWRIYNLLVHGSLYQQIPVHPSVLPVVEGVLDSGCLVSSLSSIAIGPGEIAQPIHADDQLLPIPKPHVATVCNTMWALTAFTAANGATRLVPGSHAADHSPAFGEPYDTIPAEMDAGSVLVWHGSLWHGGGANTTDERRVGIAMNYCAGWIRQQENQQLGIPREIAADFSPRLRELCGYGIYRGLIGHIDKHDPAELLDGAGAEGSMVWDHT